jgi:exosortase
MVVPRLVWPLAAVVVSGLWLYFDVLTDLVSDWANDDNYSHGFLIVPLALYFAWERRDRLTAAAVQPSVVGLVVVLGSLASLVAGVLGAEFFVARVSLLGLIAGAILFLLGWTHLRILAFPLAFLLLMIPIPSIVFNQIAFPLQLFASEFGVSTMHLAGVPVLREGNVITLANTHLEVAEACSGIRSLISLLTLGIVYGYFTDRRWWVRLMIAASTIPIAIFCNGVRVAGTGILAHHYGAETALGFFHTFSGWIVFVLAFLLLGGVMTVVKRLFPAAPVAPALASVQVNS